MQTTFREDRSYIFQFINPIRDLLIGFPKKLKIVWTSGHCGMFTFAVNNSIFIQNAIRRLKIYLKFRTSAFLGLESLGFYILPIAADLS